LLLTGEYFVLDGALALALPLRFGQELVVHSGQAADRFSWQSYDVEGKSWFRGTFSSGDGSIIDASDQSAAQWLEKLFAAIEQERPGFLQKQNIEKIITHLDFPRAWGLGSSSTLVAALAQWSQTDPFVLLGKSFGGSGYDLACATASSPILFQRQQGQPHWVQLPYQPAFDHQLYFIYLGKKQDSREGIKRYRALGGAPQEALNEINELSLRFLKARTLSEAHNIIDQHENRVSKTIQLPKVKDHLFPDFPGSIKSLGAWGGDFVMAATDMAAEEVKAYFKERGFEVCLGWQEVSLFPS